MTNPRFESLRKILSMTLDLTFDEAPCRGRFRACERTKEFCPFYDPSMPGSESCSILNFQCDFVEAKWPNERTDDKDSAD